MGSTTLTNLAHSFDIEVGNVGVTIRKGDKWRVPPGYQFDLAVVDEQGNVVSQGKGQCVGSWYGRFYEIPRNLLAIEHNYEARDYEVCLSQLRTGYGDDFSEEAMVTALIYLRTQ